MSSPARAPRAAAAALALLLVLAAAAGGAADEYMYTFMLAGSGMDNAGLGSVTYDDVAKTLTCEAKAARMGTPLRGQAGRRPPCAH